MTTRNRISRLTARLRPLAVDPEDGERRSIAGECSGRASRARVGVATGTAARRRSRSRRRPGSRAPRSTATSADHRQEARSVLAVHQHRGAALRRRAQQVGDEVDRAGREHDAAGAGQLAGARERAARVAPPARTSARAAELRRHSDASVAGDSARGFGVAREDDAVDSAAAARAASPRRPCRRGSRRPRRAAGRRVSSAATRRARRCRRRCGRRRAIVSGSCATTCRRPGTLHGARRPRARVVRRRAAPR